METTQGDALVRALTRCKLARRVASVLVPLATLVIIGSSFTAASGDLDDIPSLSEVDPALVTYLEVERASTRVITATKKEQAIEDAPAVINVVTRKDIVQHGYRTVGEALRAIPGLAVIDDHVNWNIGVRGLYAGSGGATSIMKVMINGQQTAFRPTLGNVFGPELIPITAVERIEMMRGPGSALYGANAFLGVVNIITLQGREIAADGTREEVNLEGYYRESAAGNLYNGGVSLRSGGSLGALQYTAAATWNYADRSGLYIPGLPDVILEGLYSARPENYPPPVRHPTPGASPPTRRTLVDRPMSKGDLEKVGSGYLSLSYALGPLASFNVDTSLQYFDKGGEWLDYTYLTHNTRIAYGNGFGRLKFNLTPPHQPFSLTLSATLSSGGPILSIDRYEAPAVPGVVKRRRFGYRAIDVAAEGFWQVSDDHTLTVGADYVHDAEQLVRILTAGDMTHNEGEDDGIKNFDNTGVYALWQWHAQEALHLGAGARVDRNSEIACDAQNRLCLGHRPNVIAPSQIAGGKPFEVKDRGQAQISHHLSAVLSATDLTYVKLVYGSSFRPPSPFDLYQPVLTINSGALSNPYLKPQSAYTIDLQLGLRPWNGVEGSLTAFYSEVADFVATLRQSNGILQNRNANVQLAGLEGEMHWNLSSALSLYGNVSLLLHSALTPQKTSDESDFAWARAVDNITVPAGSYPTWLVNAGANISLPEQFLNVTLAINYVGRRSASLTGTAIYSPLDLTNTYYFDAYLLANLTVSSVNLHLVSDLDTRLSVQLSGAPGNYVEAGYGGVDIPSLGPRFLCRLEQSI
jgi:outer membrane receptor for ferrienterochelin and colicins